MTSVAASPVSWPGSPEDSPAAPAPPAAAAPVAAAAAIAVGDPPPPSPPPPPEVGVAAAAAAAAASLAAVARTFVLEFIFREGGREGGGREGSGRRVGASKIKGQCKKKVNFALTFYDLHILRQRHTPHLCPHASVYRLARAPGWEL